MPVEIADAAAVRAPEFKRMVIVQEEILDSLVRP
jgi:hypothetical protein